MFIFFVFNNIIFYTQLAFVFPLLRDFYGVNDHILAFCFYLLQKDFDTFRKTSF